MIFSLQNFFLHFWSKKVLQLRLIFTNEVDSFTFVVDVYLMESFYICGCNSSLPFFSKGTIPSCQIIAPVDYHCSTQVQTGNMQNC